MIAQNALPRAQRRRLEREEATVGSWLGLGPGMAPLGIAGGPRAICSAPAAPWPIPQAGPAGGMSTQCTCGCEDSTVAEDPRRSLCDGGGSTWVAAYSCIRPRRMLKSSLSPLSGVRWVVLAKGCGEGAGLRYSMTDFHGGEASNLWIGERWSVEGSSGSVGTGDEVVR